MYITLFNETFILFVCVLWQTLLFLQAEEEEIISTQIGTVEGRINIKENGTERYLFANRRSIILM